MGFELSAKSTASAFVDRFANSCTNFSKAAVIRVSAMSSGLTSTSNSISKALRFFWAHPRATLSRTSLGT